MSDTFSMAVVMKASPKHCTTVIQDAFKMSRAPVFYRDFVLKRI